jgi:hypothetical protein
MPTPPTIALGSSSATFNLNTRQPVVIEPTVTLTEAAGVPLYVAHVKMTTGFILTQDFLALPAGTTGIGDITASFDISTGDLFLISQSQTATLAQWQTALEAVTYTSTNTQASAYNVTVQFYVADSNNQTSSLATMTVHDVTPTTPSLRLNSTYATFGSNGPQPVVLEPSLSITDSSATLASATVAITSEFQAGGDVLALSTASGIGNITASYNSASGVLTLTSAGASATVAQWTAALEAVTYNDTASTVTGDSRTIGFSFNDGQTTSSVSAMTAYIAQPTITRTSNNASFGVHGNTQPVALLRTLTLGDPLSSKLYSAAVSFQGSQGSDFFSAEDVLALPVTPGIGDITASFNATTGVLTLTSASGASFAQWQTALLAVTYADTAVEPVAGGRSIGFAVSDGQRTSITWFAGVNVLHGTPQFLSATPTAGSTVRGAEPTLQFTFDEQVYAHSGNIVIHLASNGSVVQTIPIGQASISAAYGYDNNGVYFDHGLVTYTLTTPLALGTQYYVTVDAGAVSDSNQLLSPAVGGPSQTFSTPAAVVAPTIALGSTSATAKPGSYPGNQVVLEPSLTLADQASATLASATVAITASTVGYDLLTLPATAGIGNITAFYSSGVLTLSSAGAAATLAQWQTALEAVTFGNSNTYATTGSDHTISFTVNDGGLSSTAATMTVHVAAGAPGITIGNGLALFVAGSSPVALEPSVTLASANAPIASADVVITSGFRPGEDVLALSTAQGIGNITASYNSSSGDLHLTSAGATATLAQWQAALEAVTFADTNGSATSGNRTVGFTVNDGSATSGTASMTVDGFAATPPQLQLSSTAAVLGLNGLQPVPLAPSMSVTDASSATLASATVSITSGYQAGGDQLALPTTPGVGNITAAFNSSTGVLTLTSAGGTATLAQWTTALQAVTYADLAATVTGSSRTVSFSVNDGRYSSSVSTTTVGIQAPTISLTPMGFAFGANSQPVQVLQSVAIADPFSSKFFSATVAIGLGNPLPEDRLALPATQGVGDIAASYDATAGALHLTSATGATLAQWQTALAAVTYADTAATPTGGVRVITFSVSDGQRSSANWVADLTVLNNAPPSLSYGIAIDPTYEWSLAQPKALASTLTVQIPGATTLASATIAITGNYHAGEDVLSFSSSASTGNITGSFNAASGTLSLTSAGGTATFAQWGAALSTVAYQDTSASPTFGDRSIGFSVNDGKLSSSTATEILHVQHGPPKLAAITPTAGGTLSTTAAQITLSFDEAVTARSGNITVHLASTGTAVATVSSTDTSHVTIGTNGLVTVTLPTDLLPGTSYYATVDATAFADAQGAAYGGLSQSAFSTPSLQQEATNLFTSVLRDPTAVTNPSLLSTLANATSSAQAAQSVVQAAQNTSSVATMAYEFFTGTTPSSGGMDYLVSPTGPNPNNLNSAYYQFFNIENRYINFAVNLGKLGAGAAAFNAAYGSLSLFDATKQAYGTIFGITPSDTKVHALLDPMISATMSRADYFAYYGGDGANGIGTKAAMVGWLLAEAVLADVGSYAKSNDAFLTDVALHNASWLVDMIGHYNQPGFAFNGG